MNMIIKMEASFMDSKTKEVIEQAVSTLTNLMIDPEYSELNGEIKTAINYLNHINNYCNSISASKDELKISDKCLFDYVPCGTGVAIAGYNGFDEKEIVIPDIFDGKPVIRILEGAFKDCAIIESVVLGQNITIIENSAFSSCQKLKNVKISRNLVFVGYKAFSGCVNLSEIDLPNSVSFIGEGAFERTAITSFCVPKELHFLSCTVFSGCAKLKNVMLHDQLLTVGKECFSNCSKLERIVIPPSVRFVGEDAFVNCFSLKEVEFHSTETVIGINAFSEICVYQPDLRYNIRTYHQSLKNICIKCLAGSFAQKYCRENNLKMIALTNPLNSSVTCDVSIDSLLAIEISTYQNEMVEVFKKRAFQAGLVVEVSNFSFFRPKIIIYFVKPTDYNGEKIKRILGCTEKRNIFENPITIKKISEHRLVW